MKLDIHEKLRAKFEYIETMLLWGDGITAGELAETFGLSRQAAQEIIKKYKQYFKDTIRYDQRGKRQIAKDNFEPSLINSDPMRFLDYLRGQSLMGYYRNEESWSDLEVTDIDRQLRPSTSADIIKTIIFALRKRKVIFICYRKKDLEPDDFGFRSISPNQIVFADNRYHIRAYCHKKNHYLDFVLTRIISAEISNEDWVSGKNDEGWNEYVEILFIPNPILPEKTRQAISLGYENTHKGIRRIKCRKALAHYINRSLLERINIKYGYPLWVTPDVQDI